jgi:hypothetical protein
MTDHVHDINDIFHSNLSKELQMFLLFLDTRKAFDSIHHQFLMEVLRRIGLPVWLINVIEALLADVEVSPVLANDKSLRIPIKRGVKQGCPLSPILFIILFDVLLHAISTAIPCVRHLAAADDLALTCPDLPPLFEAMLIISAFSDASGLGINYDKSALLPTILSDNLAPILRLSPWPDLVLTTSYTHLGVLIGADVTTEMIFEKAHEKAVARLTGFAPAVRRLPIHRRNTIINTYIIPIYLYLGSFFIIPYALTKAINAIIQRVVIPFHGTAFRLVHLLPALPHHHFKPALRCLWAANVAAVASYFDFANYDAEEDPYPFP